MSITTCKELSMFRKTGRTTTLGVMDKEKDKKSEDKKELEDKNKKDKK